MLDGDPVPFPQNGAESPSLIFGPLLLWPNGCMHQNATWYRGRPRPKRLCVRWGSCSPSHKGAQTPQFSAHICCGQMAAWIKTSLGMELGLDPGDFVLDGDPVALPQKGDGPPKFSADGYCDQTAGWMKLILGMVIGLSPGEFVLDGDPAYSPKRGRAPSPNLSCLLYTSPSPRD